MHDIGARAACPACSHNNADTAAKQPSYALSCGSSLIPAGLAPQPKDRFKSMDELRVAMEKLLRSGKASITQAKSTPSKAIKRSAPAKPAQQPALVQP